MIRQETNDIILAHINAELRDQPDIRQRISITFNNWFQALLAVGQQMAQPQNPPPTEEQTA